MRSVDLEHKHATCLFCLSLQTHHIPAACVWGLRKEACVLVCILMTTIMHLYMPRAFLMPKLNFGVKRATKRAKLQ